MKAELLLAALLSIAVCTAACGSADGTTGDEEATPTREAVTTGETILSLSTYYASPLLDNAEAVNTDGADFNLFSSRAHIQYTKVRSEACVLRSPGGNDGRLPLKRFRNYANGDTFSTASAFGIQSAIAGGYSYIETVGYVLPSSRPGTVPLQWWSNAARHDNILVASDNSQNLRAQGYSLVRVEGYAYSRNYCPNGVGGVPNLDPPTCLPSGAPFNSLSGLPCCSGFASFSGFCL